MSSKLVSPAHATLRPVPTGSQRFGSSATNSLALMQYLRRGIAKPYVMLFDLSAIDERLRGKRDGQPASDFTVFYHLMSLERNEDLRVKVALAQSDCSLPSVVGVYPGRELVRTRSIRHVRHPFRRPPEPAPDTDAAALGGTSAAQGTSGARDRDGSVQDDQRISGSRSRKVCASCPRSGACRAARNTPTSCS